MKHPLPKRILRRKTSPLTENEQKDLSGNTNGWHDLRNRRLLESMVIDEQEMTVHLEMVHTAP